MKFQVGKFTCELSRDDNGEVRETWQAAAAGDC
jgi:hypothetical protein